jgi:hypothetical protein
MSFANNIDRAYQSTRMTPAEQRAYNRLHACRAPDCDAPVDETKPCELCGDHFCDDDLYDGLCMPCFNVDEAAEKFNDQILEGGDTNHGPIA